jgi:predicted lactoylglutathione lyase
MGIQAKQIYVNLPVKDLQKTIAFFSELGFEFNPQFSDDKAACLVIGENIFAMLLVEEFFQGFTKKEIPDTSRNAQVIVAVSADSRAQVDEIVNKALAAGGASANDPTDHGFMYEWGFQDLDGHHWEFNYMDVSALAQG